MAKPKQAPAVTPETDICVWAADVLRLRFEEVISFGGAIHVPWNVNAVHDMRVALRRLRSALRDFVQVIDEKPLKRVKDDLKKISDLLGAVRDLDVAVIALDEFSSQSNDEEIVNGIGELAQVLRLDRDRAHLILVKAFESISLDDLHRRFSSRIEESLRQQELFSPGTLNEAGRTVIEARLREFCDLSTAIYDPFNIVELHDLRIAAKRLRYAIELFGVGWGDEIGGFVPELSKMQSFLGEVHDCDVWTSTLTKILKENGKAKTQNLTIAAAWLLSKFVAKRSKEYRGALELWNNWQTNGFVYRLRTVLDSK